jgi:hypothetical protein
LVLPDHRIQVLQITASISLLAMAFNKSSAASFAHLPFSRQNLKSFFGLILLSCG